MNGWINRLKPANKTSRVLHAIAGRLREEPIPKELLWRCGDEHPGGWGDPREDPDGGEGGGGKGDGFRGGPMHGPVLEPLPSRAWTTHTAAFAPCLRLLVELACSCAMAGDEPSPLLFPGPEGGEGEGDNAAAGMLGRVFRTSQAESRSGLGARAWRQNSRLEPLELLIDYTVCVY